MMKIIFITSFHGLVSRVLEGGIVDDLLLNKSVRVVIFVPDFKTDYFEEVFGGNERVTIEGVGRGVLSRRAQFLNKLTFVLLNTNTMYLTRRSFRGYGYFHKFFIAQFIASFFGRWRFVRNTFRYLNYFLLGKGVFSSYFKKYNPDLVFSTDIKEMLDVELLIEAKKRDVLTVGMVRSWDYLTGKGMTRVKPDKLVVHNEVIKKEAVELADMKEERIYISGIPHFDLYINEVRSEREDFLKRVGLKGRYILYVPWGDKFADTDWEFLSILGSAIREGRLPKDLSILLRLPPGDTVSLDKLDDEIRSRVVVDSPGVTFGSMHRKANEMSLSDLRHLADVIYHSELLVSPPSTMPIDAAALDKPTVIMKFDGKEEKPYYEGVMHYFDFVHIKNLLSGGSFAVATNQNELIRYINDYIENPSIHKVERKVLVGKQCYKLDGKSGKRLTDFLIKEI